jgi:hypothetical protein
MTGPHLFRCEECRAEWRLRRAWKRMPGPPKLEVDAPVDERFVVRVLAALREDRKRRLRLALLLAAAAALLFFFFLGEGRQRAFSSAAGEEQAYSQLAAPSDLGELLLE